jgi:transposase
VLLFGDESEALTHPYLCALWAKRGVDLRFEAPGKAKKRALLGVREALTGHLLVRTSTTKRSTDFIALLALVDARYAPVLWDAARDEPTVVLVLDNGPIHTSKATKEALAARPWLRVEWLARYAPELNDIEHDWRYLKEQYLSNQVFTDAEHLDQRIHFGVRDINEQRARNCKPN